MRVRRVLPLFVWLGTACTARFTGPPEPTETEGVRPRCAEVGGPLTIDPAAVSVGGGQLFVFAASGGTGRYRWSLAERPSGGEIDPNAGVYFAGAPVAGETTVDVVRLEDEGCRDETTSSVTVVDAPSVAPSRVELEPGDGLVFEVSGGSGTVTFALASNESGASVGEDGRYTAGPTLGTDVVRVRDEMLGVTADAMVQVVSDASLRLATRAWVVPLGATVTLPLEGGSGVFDVESSAPAATYRGGTTFEGTEAGVAAVSLVDHFTARTLDLRVTVVAPHEPTRWPQIDRQETHRVAGVADIDGDGFTDVVIAMLSASFDWYQSGGVSIYRGSASGIDPEPVRVISGRTSREELGSSASLADLDGDGLVDLLVGARRVDGLRADGGALFVYPGVADGFFAEEPSRAFYGINGSDLFGSAHATCDLNGDGLIDLAVAAPFAEDPDRERPPDADPFDHGAVHVFLAYPNGRFTSRPDSTIYGRIVDGGALRYERSTHFGSQLVAGDFDGDGICDLAAYAASAMPATNNNGAAYLMLGRPVMGPDRGGPDGTYARIITRADGVQDQGQLAQDVALGDVNGDGRADLLLSRYLHDGADGGDTGALYLFLGGQLDGPVTAVTDVATADWSVEGKSQDRLGNGADLYDVNGDGLLDVISGDSRAAIPDSELNRPGVVRVYYGHGGGPSTTPDVEREGPLADVRYGLGLGGAGDHDGDGVNDLIVFAPYYGIGDEQPNHRGAVFYQPSRAGAAPVELSWSRRPRGSEVGRALGWLGDLDGDGFPELAVATPAADRHSLEFDSGAVFLHRGTASGVEPVAYQVLDDFRVHSEGDQVGYWVRPAGDFDGDGRVDLAVMALGDDLPSSFDDTLYAVGPGCDAARNNAGSILVFAGVGDGTFEPEPAFIYYGAEAGQLIYDMAAGLDIDGDGLTDLVAGGRDWDRAANNAGGFEVVLGRARSGDGRTSVICQGQRVDGVEENARFGWVVSGVGDLDADGCADFAVSAPHAVIAEQRFRGTVSVYFGWGASCAATTPRSVMLDSTVTDNQTGLALGGGEDLTRDGVPDLVVGAPLYRDGRGEIGRVYLVSGAYVRSHIGERVPLIDPASTASFVVDGTSPGERLGAAVDLVSLSGGGAALFLGGPFGGSAGIVDTGGAGLYDADATGFTPSPRVQVSGETFGEGQLGAAVDAYRQGTRLYLAVGAPVSGAIELADGASYAFVLE